MERLLPYALRTRADGRVTAPRMRTFAVSAGLDTRRGSAEAHAPWQPFLGLTLAYVCLSYAVGWAVGWRGPVVHPYTIAGTATVALLLVAMSAIIFHLSGEIGELRPLVGRVCAVLLPQGLAFAVQIGWRVSIPTVHPFAWGPTLDAWDVALHGDRPWRLAHAIAASPVLAGWFPAVVDVTYTHVWALANLLLVLVLTVTPIQQRGQRVLVAYVLQLAVLGSCLAVVFSSAGPVYYGHVVAGPNPYAGLVPSLGQQLGASRALSALNVQAYLWHQHLAGNAGPTTGISAFPSMHVASSTLIALALRSWRRWAGVIGWAFVALVLFGSVYLGWHYAVDGYASIVGTLALWRVAGWLTARRPGIVHHYGHRSGAGRSIGTRQLSPLARRGATP